ncbi:MAG: hypothetical protein OEY14_16405, partial [Myxococcales bacterium]|nr:hypothetical protein [Myxococcales bacterium]
MMPVSLLAYSLLKTRARGPIALAMALILGPIACGGGDAPPSDGGGDAADAGDGAMIVCEEIFSHEIGAASGHADPLGAAAGEARAGLVGAGMLPADPSGLLTWAEGDFVLANSRVAAVIEAAGPSDGYDPWGGKLVGLARIEGGSLIEPADFNELIPGIGRFTVQTESVTVMADGSAGGAAIVRAVGMLQPIPFIDEFAEAIAPWDMSGVEVAVDYALEPDAEVVTITYTFSNERASSLRFDPFLLAFQKERMAPFVSGTGFAVPEAVNLEWIGFEEAGATSYAVEPILGPMQIALDVSGTLVLRGRPAIFEPCVQTERHLFSVHIGGPGSSELRAAMARTAGEGTRVVSGTVFEGDGVTGAAGVRVHAETADGATYLARALTDGGGAYSLTLPADQDARLYAYRRGDTLVGPSAADVATSSVDLTMLPSGWIHVEARVAGMGPQPTLPVRVQVQAAAGTSVAQPPASFGERRFYGDRLDVAFPIDGIVDLRMPPGDYLVTVSRGYEYELGFNDIVSVAADATTLVQASLDRVVDTAGWLCADYHIHTNRSADGDDPGEYKLASAAGDGLEIPCRSDHEFVRDFETEIASMGLGDWLYGVTSLELTTFAWGHFGVLPMEVRPDLPNAGAISWYAQTPPEVFAEVRALPWAPALIINHPRGVAQGSYFSAAGYDRITGTTTSPELWDSDFGLVEVFNDSSFEQNFDETVADWFSFLNRGRPVFAVGSSDSHHVDAGSPVGYPRTCIDVGDPAMG